MAANPNSSLVFDFPDPAPVFEFGDSHFSSKKNNRRGGKGFGKSKKLSKGGKFGIGRDKNSDGPSKLSTGSTTSAAGRSNFGDDFFATDFGDLGDFDLGGGKASDDPPRKHSSLLKSRHNSGDNAASPSIPGGSVQLFAAPHFDLSPSNPPPSGKANPDPAGPGHARATSSTSSTGFISEVSEFSFDRVTVTTNQSGHTNQSSHLSWNFLDDGVVDAVGGGQDAFVPHTGDAGVPPIKGGEKRRPVRHRKNKSTSTFSNVSLSSDEEADNIPFTGVVEDDETRSVVSEISKRTEDLLDGGASDAVNVLLREGMESARRKEEEEKRANRAANGGSNEEKSETKARGGDAGRAAKIRVCRGDASPPGNTLGTASTVQSTSSGGSAPARSKTFLVDVQEKYAKFKTDRKRGKEFSLLHSIVEDVQFCGLYLCGINTTRDDAVDGDGSGSGRGGGDSAKSRRDERRREADNTFLGRVIRCGNDLGCVSL